MLGNRATEVSVIYQVFKKVFQFDTTANSLYCELNIMCQSQEGEVAVNLEYRQRSGKTTLDRSARYHWKSPY